MSLRKVTDAFKRTEMLAMSRIVVSLPICRPMNHARSLHMRSRRIIQGGKSFGVYIPSTP